MKRTVLTVLVVTVLSAISAVIVRIVLLDGDSWRASLKLSTALKGARAVTLVEYVPNAILARKTATADEIARLRNAANVWLCPFDPTYYLSCEPHHRLEIVRADGSEVAVLIAFGCKQFGFTDDEKVVVIPPSLTKSLASFFASVGMAPKTSGEYDAIVARQIEEVAR